MFSKRTLSSLLFLSLWQVHLSTQHWTRGPTQRGWWLSPEGPVPLSLVTSPCCEISCPRSFLPSWWGWLPYLSANSTLLSCHMACIPSSGAPAPPPLPRQAWHCQCHLVREPWLGRWLQQQDPERPGRRQSPLLFQPLALEAVYKKPILEK